MVSFQKLEKREFSELITKFRIYLVDVLIDFRWRRKWLWHEHRERRIVTTSIFYDFEAIGFTINIITNFAILQCEPEKIICQIERRTRFKSYQKLSKTSKLSAYAYMRAFSPMNKLSGISLPWSSLNDAFLAEIPGASMSNSSYVVTNRLLIVSYNKILNQNWLNLSPSYGL